MSDIATVHRLAPASAAPGSRVARKAARVAALVKAVRDLAHQGVYQPKASVVAGLAGTTDSEPARLFGSSTGLAAHVARHYAADLVDTLALSPKARAALTPADERAIALAVLAGRREEGQ